MPSRWVTRSMARRYWKDRCTPTRRNLLVPDSRDEHEHGDEVEELAHERDFHLGQGVEDFRGAEAHLEREELARELEGGKDEVQEETDQQPDGHFPQDEETVVQRVRGNWDSGRRAPWGTPRPTMNSDNPILASCGMEEEDSKGSQLHHRDDAEEHEEEEPDVR